MAIVRVTAEQAGRQTGEVSKLDQFGLERFLRGPLIQRFAECDHVLVRLGHRDEVRVEIFTLPAAAVFGGPFAFGGGRAATTGTDDAAPP
jgi:hypothetical protein